MSEEKFESFFTEDQNLTNNAWDSLFGLINPSKSPGSPLCFVHSTNKELSKMENSIRLVVEYRVVKLVELGQQLHQTILRDLPTAKHAFGFDRDMETSSTIAIDLVKSNLCDPILLREKNEPRKLGKLPRLVCGVSVQDNLVHRLAFHNQLVTEQASSGCPIAVSLDLNTPEKTSELYVKFKEHSPVYSSDIKGWDFSTKPEYVLNDTIRTCYMMGVCDVKGNPYPGKESHFYLSIAIAYCLIHRLLQTSDGELFVSTPGMTTSGTLRTFSQNSFIRSFVSVQAEVINLGVSPQQLHTVSVAPTMFVFSGGDDNLTNSPAPPYCTEALGFTVTDYERQTDSFSFCSTTFTDTVSYQDNISKFFVAVMYDKSNWITKMNSFRICFSNHPEYSYYTFLLDCERPLDENSDSTHLNLGLWDDNL